MTRNWKNLIYLGGFAQLAAMLGFVCMTASAHAADACTISIGRVVPVTGLLAVAGKMTPWVDDHKLQVVNASGGLQVGDEKCHISYKIYDSQSTVAGAVDAATRAILEDKVDLLIAQFAGAATDVCERYNTPCISTTLPIEAWLLGPDGKPKQFKNTYHFFFSVADLVKNNIGMIKALPGGFNGKIGYLYPNDADGVVAQSLFDPALRAAGYEPVDPGRFPEGLPDFSSIVNQFKRNQVEVVVGVLSPPDLQSYLQQAAQSGFKAKMYDIDKATGYAEAMDAIGPLAVGLLGVNAWSPAFPGESKYGNWTAQRLADAFAKDNPSQQYSHTLGYEDAAYDIAFDAFQRAGSKDPDRVKAALAATDLDTVVSRVHFNDQHFSVQPLAGAQWRYDAAGKHWIKETVFNSVFPSVAITAPMQVYNP